MTAVTEYIVKNWPANNRIKIQKFVHVCIFVLKTRGRLQKDIICVYLQARVGTNIGIVPENVLVLSNFIIFKEKA